MTIGTKLRLLMIFLVLTLFTMSAISFWTSNKFVNQVNDLVDVQLPGVSSMTLADMMHDGIRANVYHAILVAKSTDAKEKEEVKKESLEFAENINNYINDLQKLSLASSTKAAIAPALPRIKEYVDEAEKIVGFALSGDEAKALENLPEFNKKFDNLEKELGTLGDLIRADSKKSTEQSDVIKNQSKYYNLASLVIGFILVTFFACVVNAQQNQLKKIISSLDHESKRIKVTATNLNASANNLSTSTTAQASAFQQSAAALEQISATASTTETNSKKLDGNAKESLHLATNGKSAIDEMLGAMGTINTSNSEMTKQIEEGNKKISEIVVVINEIGNKTKVINDIVFQTKLLSFNASVEAARAGEQGKGFAVVAEEVGNLAAMSGNAAKEISELLATSIATVQTIVNESKHKVESLAHDGRGKVEVGIGIANQCGSALEEIVDQAGSINNLINEITVAVREQSKGIVEVSEAMNLLDQTCNKNSITSQETLESSKDLTDQVRKLENVINLLASMMTKKAA